MNSAYFLSSGARGWLSITLESILQEEEFGLSFHRENPGAGTKVFRVSDNTYLYQLSPLAGLVLEDVTVNIDAHLTGLRII